MIIQGARLVGGRYEGIEPVPEGLVLMLDAQDYPGSGTTWPAAVGANATLYNSPTYTATSPWYFSFDPNNAQWADAPDLGSLSNWTIEAWFRITADLTTQITQIVGGQYSGPGGINFSMSINAVDPNTNLIKLGYYDANTALWQLGSGIGLGQNSWVQLAATFDGTNLTSYIYGYQVQQLPLPGVTTSGGLVYIARRWDDLFHAAMNFFPGDVALVRIYDIAISGAAVAQNYQASASRFGLV